MDLERIWHGRSRWGQGDPSILSELMPRARLSFVKERISRSNLKKRSLRRLVKFPQHASTAKISARSTIYPCKYFEALLATPAHISSLFRDRGISTEISQGDWGGLWNLTNSKVSRDKRSQHLESGCLLHSPHCAHARASGYLSSDMRHSCDSSEAGELPYRS